MLQNKFMYIVTRDGQIFEFGFTEERFAFAVACQRDKGIFAIEGSYNSINGSDITKVLDERNYDNYIETVRPIVYPRKGVWFSRNRKSEAAHPNGKIEPWLEEKKKKQTLLENEKPRQKTIDPETARRKIEEIRKSVINKIKQK